MIHIPNRPRRGREAPNGRESGETRQVARPHRLQGFHPSSCPYLRKAVETSRRPMLSWRFPPLKSALSKTPRPPYPPPGGERREEKGTPIKPKEPRTDRRYPSWHWRASYCSLPGELLPAGPLPIPPQGRQGEKACPRNVHPPRRVFIPRTRRFSDFRAILFKPSGATWTPELHRGLHHTIRQGFGLQGGPPPIHMA